MYFFRCRWKKPIRIKEEQCQKLYVSEFRNELYKIYKKLSPADGIRACIINKQAVKKIWPLLGQKPRSMLPQFCGKRNPKMLKMYLLAHKQIKLPKHILLSEMTYTIYIGPRYTKITERDLEHFGLDQDEEDDYYVIKKANNSQPLQNTAVPNLNLPTVDASSNSDQSSDVGSNDVTENTNGDVSQAEPHSENSEDTDSNTSADSIKTEPTHSIRFRNQLLIPGKMSNDQIQSLIHTSKEKFLDFVNVLKGVYRKKNVDVLSVSARAFLFRMKVNMIK